MTDGLLVSVGNRDKMKRILDKNYSIELKQHYTLYRNTVNKIIKNTKTNYYKTKINDSGRDYKKIWRVL